MKKYYSINDLCDLAQVSVRTLHHYDQIDLLKPHHRTEKNHRRYTRDSLLRLQQIAMLKFIGLSLHEIKQFFANKDYNIYDSLKMQNEILSEQVDQIKQIMKLINYLMNEYELQKPLDWKIIIQIANVLKNNKLGKQCWYDHFLTKTEQQLFEHHGFIHMAEWHAILDEINDNVDEDPNSAKSKALIDKLLDFAQQHYGEQPGLIQKLWEAYKADIITTQSPQNKEIIAFIEKAHLAKMNDYPVSYMDKEDDNQVFSIK